MKELLDFLIKNITGLTNYTIEDVTEDSFTKFIVKTKADEAGLVIGKRGKTVNTIRNLLKVRATLENRGVAISVESEEK